MNIAGVLFLISSVGLMISPFVLMFAKAHYHFEYLKKIEPIKFKKYNNYLDTSKNIFYNKYFFLLFPFFKRQWNKEKTEEIKKLAEKVELFCRLIYYDIAFLLVYIVALLVFLGDSS